ncbi:hypothetical protein [Halomonas alkaliantarctica]|nr:hypothetical protein [Halomonas alkaliantarctica]
MKPLSTLAVFVVMAALLLGGTALAWWGWHSLDSSLLLFGSRLC